MSKSENARQAPENAKTAIFGGGCFWCVEAVYESIDGVVSAESGYAGGQTDNPTYEAVCSGSTGHAEVVKIIYDPDKVSYGELLRMFWRSHNPTTLNRQGADVGTQYRSIILYTDDAQKEEAERSKAEAQNHFETPTVTEITPLARFYPAEGHHQDYYRINKRAPYCQAVIAPKLNKLGLGD